mgnify:CR=1 FL=1
MFLGYASCGTAVTPYRAHMAKRVCPEPYAQVFCKGYFIAEEYNIIHFGVEQIRSGGRFAKTTVSGRIDTAQ